jgi:hypothetical protein
LTALGFNVESRVPVTAKLSRNFYERFGDEIAGELVDWFNAVDLTYQTQLKETNEVNWERFKAALQGESAAMRGELQAETAAIRGELRAEAAAIRGEFRSEMSAMRADLLKWMFLYWTGTVLTIIGMGLFGPR